MACDDQPVRDRVVSATSHAECERFELGFACWRHTPAAKSTLVDEDELRPMLEILPHLEASTTSDAHIALLRI